MSGERVLRLEGGRNFRDLGGYSTADGRRLHWRRLYRSGSMAGLTDADFARLEGLGVRAMIDLRTTYEREAMPHAWDRLPGVSYWARDYGHSFGDLRNLLASETPTIEAVREAMFSVYRELPFEQAEAYRELFRRLAEGDTPLVFNCSAGKDRTGVAAALVLLALGVARETVVEDYLLTNSAYDWRRHHGDPASPVSRLAEELAAAILGVEAPYLEAALQVIEARHGSVAVYLEVELGVTAEALERIRAHLLE